MAYKGDIHSSVVLNNNQLRVYSLANHCWEVTPEKWHKRKRSWNDAGCCERPRVGTRQSFQCQDVYIIPHHDVQVCLFASKWMIKEERENIEWVTKSMNALISSAETHADVLWYKLTNIISSILLALFPRVQLNTARWQTLTIDSVNTWGIYCTMRSCHRCNCRQVY